MRRRQAGPGSLRAVVAERTRDIGLLWRLGTPSESTQRAVLAEAARIEAGGVVEFSGWQARGFGLEEYGRYRLEADDTVTRLDDRVPEDEVTDLAERRAKLRANRAGKVE